MVAGPAWWVLEEVEVAVADAPLATYATAAVLVAALVVLAVAIALDAFWWRLASLHDRALADQYRVLANRIQAQKQDRKSVASGQRWSVRVDIVCLRLIQTKKPIL